MLLAGLASWWRGPYRPGAHSQWKGRSGIIPARSDAAFCLKPIASLSVCGFIRPAWLRYSMKRLSETLITIAVLGGILLLSAVFTNWFTRKMYFTCSQCRALNAKRRTHCRICTNQLTVNKEQPSEKAE